MTPERWRQVKTVLEGALEREETARTTFLDAACEEDGELRREVESLLVSEDEIGDFIETPLFQIHAPEEALTAGQRVGAYRILRQLGRGGMGSVYLAERADEEFEHRVAIKVVRRGMDTAEIVRRFRSERQILAHLDHPNVAKLLDGGTTQDGRPYFVMEHVEGRPIDEYCDARGLPLRERLELFRQVCSAVHFAHQNLIVHRDLKPGNILVTADGTPKLLDFGIAKLLDPGHEVLTLTLADLRPMTPEYASPEQVLGEPITTASDVYSLGVLLYLLLTGHLPYRPALRDPESLARAICQIDPPRPSSVVGRVEEVKRPDGSVSQVTPESVGRSRDGDPRLLRRRLAGDLDTIVLMAMRKEPQRRYASVDQLSNDVGRHLEGLPVIARQDTLGYRTAKFVGRHKLGVGLAAGFLLLILGFSITVTVLLERNVREQKRTKTAFRFLEVVFSSSDPSQARGESVSAQEALDRGRAVIREEFADDPEMRADLMEMMGRIYRSAGSYELAKELLQDSLRVRRETLEKDDPRVASSLHNLASVLRDLGESGAAESLIREALAIQRSEGESLDYAAGLTNLATIMEMKEQLDEAESLLQQSLAIKRALPEVTEEDIAISYNNIGRLAYTRGDLDAAERNYRIALDMRRKLFGTVAHPDVATSLSNMASLLDERGDFDGAEKLHSQAVAMRRKLFGNRHPRVARSLNNLAFVKQHQGDTRAAERYYREALSIAEEKGDAHRPVYMRNLATALVDQGKIAEAEARIQQALAIFRAGEPPPWRIADAESVLGSCLAAQGRFEEAEPLLVDSYRVLERESGDGAKYAPAALQRLRDFYATRGKPESTVIRLPLP